MRNARNCCTTTSTALVQLSALGSMTDSSCLVEPEHRTRSVRTQPRSVDNCHDKRMTLGSKVETWLKSALNICLYISFTLIFLYIYYQFIKQLIFSQDK